MTYSHRMISLPAQYDTAVIEKKWQDFWLANNTYAWNPNASREESYVIDTPPPTVSGTLHMGHVYSYTQADFIARFQRMNGKNVFYPMGFDDNGLPTERLVEKTRKLRAADMSREAFIEQCMEVSEEARAEFRALFRSIALSVDWSTEYHTISESSRRLSQLSFLDLIKNDHAYRALKPVNWDPVDQTTIAQAEIVDMEIASTQNYILFTVIPSNDGIPLGEEKLDPVVRRDDTHGEYQVPVMTTRPELLPACVALMYHPDDAALYEGKTARTPLFNIDVPMVADEKVNKEKGTGLVMCCTFGDDTDVQWWREHKLADRIILNKYGKLDFSNLPLEGGGRREAAGGGDLSASARVENTPTLTLPPQGGGNAPDLYALLQGKKVSNKDPKNLGAREIIIQKLKDAGLLTEQKPITHSVKCAERSGAPLEILPTHQWFVRISDKKEALKAKADQCHWNPDYMKVRIDQWIDGLNQDWAISRQRYFGVPFPVWYAIDAEGKVRTIVAKASELPVNPLVKPPQGMEQVLAPTLVNGVMIDGPTCIAHQDIFDIEGKLVFKGDGHTHVKIMPDADVMDTWATSSISPQISAGAISQTVTPSNDGVPLGTAEKPDPVVRRGDTLSASERFNKLFPADLRPQAHEIIRTWAFYTIVKAHLHNDSIPWKNLMISGWCLAEDKSKMSKSKGNVVTPVALIEEKGTDAVRYWAGTSRLGQDTAFSPDLLKIGKKLVGKLWNATAFAAIHLQKMDAAPATAASDSAITEILDQWILSRLGETVQKATAAFARYEYADALDATNTFFWADFCDNYLELIKKRVYNEDGSCTAAQQQSAVRALYYCLDGILKLYAPFTPHVTEELYSHIFADKYKDIGSLHGKGQWPLAKDYSLQENALAGWQYTKELMEHVRRIKSEASKSVKWPVTVAQFPTCAIFGHEVFGESKKSLDSLAYDLKGAGNINALEWGAKSISITLAAEADAA